MEQMQRLRKQIAVGLGREPADLVIKSCRIVNVYTHSVRRGDIAVCGGRIAGISWEEDGLYIGKEEVDGEGMYALPGLIESHIHIESSFLTPEEFGRLMIPRGTTTVIADPHEIVNVCGLTGLEYMRRAGERSPLDIFYMLPSCVPSTPFEHGGAAVGAGDMDRVIGRQGILGLGEFMNAPGVLEGNGDDLAKLLLAKERGRVVDGHGPGLKGAQLAAYVGAGILTDHECSTVEEMQERLEAGMYVQLRYGSACRDLERLAMGVTEENSRRCLLCSDDRQPLSLLKEGDLDEHLRVCVKAGIHPVTAIQMASLNAAECYGLRDRGAIAPGKRADIVLVEDLEDFRVRKVWVKGVLCAENGRFLGELEKEDFSAVGSTVNVSGFGEERLEMNLSSDEVYVIDVVPGSVVTGKGRARIKRTQKGDFQYENGCEIAKLAVVERHHGTGNVATALIRGYGIRKGAVALSIAHDSHNIITAGVDNRDMALAVKTLIAQRGGIVLAGEGRILGSMPLPVGGLMSDMPGEWVAKKLEELHRLAVEELGVSREIEPLMTLCFMSLPVIPSLKLTDMGLFDVEEGKFLSY